MSAQPRGEEEFLTGVEHRDPLGALPPDLENERQKLEEIFTVDTATLQRIIKRFGEELQQGLERQGQNIPMNITWVTSLPNGHETGTYIALDLGGTNLRVCQVTLPGDNSGVQVVQERYELPSKLKTGTSEELWSFVADSLEQFIQQHQTEPQNDGTLPLGFTFSYPATQDRIDHGALQTWTKGWDIDGVEGQDVAAMLKDAMEKRNLPIKLVALINDTTGALIASKYKDPDTIIGAVFGTGCNAAYIEETKNIPKMRLYDERKGSSSGTSGHEGDDGLMAINCEYGAFDNSHAVLPRTSYDEKIDKESPRPGEQTFEKMSAGLYLGEIFREVVVDMWRRGIIFQSGSDTEEHGSEVDGVRDTSDDNNNDVRKETKKSIDEPYVIDTGFLSQIENDESDGLGESRKLFMDQLYLPDSRHGTRALSPTPEELLLMRHVAQLIAIRGARLCVCGVSAICQRLGVVSGHVAADGSVAIKHPHFQKRWEMAVAEVLGLERGKIKLTSAEDGSGIGAAVITALTMSKGGR